MSANTVTQRTHHCLIPQSRNEIVKSLTVSKLGERGLTQLVWSKFADVFLCFSCEVKGGAMNV